MTNGCICCTLREDLLEEVAALAREGRFEYLLIESSGISEPMPVAATFTFEDEEGTSSRGGAPGHHGDRGGRRTFLQRRRSADALADRGLEAGEGDERTIADLLIEQVEFADVILLNKMDLVTSRGSFHVSRRSCGA
jgi:G3E family GTPase